MKEYSKYDSTTGEILCSGVCTDEHFFASSDLVGGRFDDTKYYVDRGFVVPFPEKPSDEHIWDWPSLSWVYSPPPLDDIAILKRAAIQIEKIRIRDGGVTVDNILFDTDASARAAYTKAMVFSFSQDPTAVIQDWKASDGVWIQMTYPLLASIVPIIVANETKAFAWQAAREAEINLALVNNDRAALEAVSTTYE